MPNGLTAITDDKDPGLIQLERALNCKHFCARLAAATVLPESDLNVNNPTRKKACEVLVDGILSSSIGPAARHEAICVLDKLLKGHSFVDVGKYQLAKTKDGLVVQDDFRLCTWTDDGKLEVKERETKIPVGDKSASVIIGINTLGVKYTDESRISARLATFDGGDLARLQWTEAGEKGQVEFVAVRSKDGDKYIDEWTITVPDPVSGLTKPIKVKGKFALTKEKYTYDGEDWREPDSNRILHQVQEPTGKGVKEYRD
jgi:hypothetical protein